MAITCSTGGRMNMMAGRFKEFADRIKDDRLVIHDEDVFARRRLGFDHLPNLETGPRIRRAPVAGQARQIDADTGSLGGLAS